MFILYLKMQIVVDFIQIYLKRIHDNHFKHLLTTILQIPIILQTFL